MVISETAREFRPGIELVGVRLLGDQLQIDEIVEHVFLSLGAFELFRQPWADIGQGLVKILLGYWHAVDAREHLGVGVPRDDRGSQSQGERGRGGEGAAAARWGRQNSHGGSCWGRRSRAPAIWSARAY